MTAAELGKDSGGVSFSVLDQGISTDADRLRRAFGAALNAEPSVIYGRRERELFETYLGCSEADWDGHGANPISRSTYDQAWHFLHLLPAVVPSPEISADPDGDIVFEWVDGRRWVFAVSINGEGRVSYSGIFGRSTAYGTEIFLEVLPRPIEVNLARFFAKRRAGSA